MKKIFTASLIFLCLSSAFAQKIYHNKGFGITIEIPQTWWEDNRNGFPAEIELSKSERKKILDDSNSVFLTLFYDRETIKEGGNYIPKMQFNVASNYEKDFKVLLKATENNVKIQKKFQPDFKLVKKPKEVKIAGIKSIGYVATYSMMVNGKTTTIRSFTYVIPYNNYVFHLNFTDEINGKDRSKEFEAAVKTIKIG
ncbi:hypothetical protein ABS768_00340 [Flavobacterium sp. ST-75]|uniref:PsbP C-terminal domain-containing protein n=1 Tax=Flavobacterium rhizophilum TaxID=3163296 RepID=A0ABW8Y9J0_9FLAO